MKTSILLTGLFLTVACLSTRAQMQTLVATADNTNSAVITVSSNSYAILKSSNSDYSFRLLVNMQGVNFTFDSNLENIPANLTIAGPATIQLQETYIDPVFVTFDVVPGPFPPGKTMTVGANSGNVQVTMENSTDLVNWTPAVNGAVYTNSPDARFFRIKMVTNP